MSRMGTQLYKDCRKQIRAETLPLYVLFWAAITMGLFGIICTWLFEELSYLCGTVSFLLVAIAIAVFLNTQISSMVMNRYEQDDHDIDVKSEALCKLLNELVSESIKKTSPSWRFLAIGELMYFVHKAATEGTTSFNSTEINELLAACAIIDGRKEPPTCTSNGEYGLGAVSG